MKKLLLLAGLLTVMPVVARAEMCVDFDDDMNVIEYDCSKSFDDVIANQEQIQRRKEAEAKAKHEEEQAKREAERQRKAAEEKAYAESLVKKCKMSGKFSDCYDINYFVAGSFMNIAKADVYGAEMGFRIEPVVSNWYSTFSVLGLMGLGNNAGSGGFYYKTDENQMQGDGTTPVYASNIEGALTYNAVFLNAGVGYKLLSFLDVYGKIAAGVYRAKYSEISDVNPLLSIGEVPEANIAFSIGPVFGVNLRLYKWLHIYTEFQGMMDEPSLRVRSLKNDKKITPEITSRKNAFLRMGVKLVF